MQCGRPGFDPCVGKISWRREWLPTPVFLPGELRGKWSLLGYNPWGCKELDTTERLLLTHWLTQSTGESGLNKLSWEESRTWDPQGYWHRWQQKLYDAWGWSCLAIFKLWQSMSLSWQLSSVVWFCKWFWMTFESVSLVLWTIL